MGSLRRPPLPVWAGAWTSCNDLGTESECSGTSVTNSMGQVMPCEWTMMNTGGGTGGGTSGGTGGGGTSGRLRRLSESCASAGSSSGGGGGGGGTAPSAPPAVITTFTLSGDVSDYDQTTQDSIADVLATNAGVARSVISSTVRIPPSHSLLFSLSPSPSSPLMSRPSLSPSPRPLCVSSPRLRSPTSR